MISSDDVLQVLLIYYVALYVLSQKGGPLCVVKIHSLLFLRDRLYEGETSCLASVVRPPW